MVYFVARLCFPKFILAHLASCFIQPLQVGPPELNLGGWFSLETKVLFGDECYLVSSMSILALDLFAALLRRIVTLSSPGCPYKSTNNH